MGRGGAGVLLLDDGGEGSQNLGGKPASLLGSTCLLWIV